jgi:ubiquinone/menaquinone biosynthesis C-methylase UbiE
LTAQATRQTWGIIRNNQDMKFFDIIAPLYARVHLSDEKTFITLRRLADFKETDKVLDLGGGAGRVAKFFSAKGLEIAVLDPSAGMISECKKKGGINCIAGVAENIPFDDLYFDKIIIIDAFHHFQNHGKAIPEIRRVLKENGKLIIEEVEFGRIGNWLLEKLEALVGAKSKIFMSQDLVKMFSENKFQKIFLEKIRGGYYFVCAKTGI